MDEHQKQLSQQVYARACLDNTFKYLLSDKRVRNRFLSLILNIDIEHSTLNYTSLNPVRENDRTYLKDTFNGPQSL